MSSEQFFFETPADVFFPFGNSSCSTLFFTSGLELFITRMMEYPTKYLLNNRPSSHHPQGSPFSFLSSKNPPLEACQEKPTNEKRIQPPPHMRQIASIWNHPSYTHTALDMYTD